jgi:hypothetical protein
MAQEDAGEVAPEEITEEQLAAEEAEDFAAAMAGTEVPERDAGEAEETAEGAADVVAEAEETEEAEEVDPLAQFEERITNRLRNIEGKFGGLKSEVMRLEAAQQAASETRSAGEATPTAAQIQEAVKSGPAMESLRKDFPEFVDAFEEERGRTPQIDVDSLKNELREEFKKETGAYVTREQNQSEVEKARQMAVLDFHHPDWETTIGTQEYNDWLMSQPEETVALTKSASARDALKVLDSYRDFTASPPPSLTASSRQRLESAVTPTQGRASPVTPRLTEHDEFLAALNS